MKIVYVISRYTSASRSVETHADNGNGKPLCNDKPRGRTNGWAQDEGNVTCKKCRAIIESSEQEPPCNDGKKYSDKSAGGLCQPLCR